MFFPICTRCHSKNNFGSKICCSCKITLAFAKEINTELKKNKGNKLKTMRGAGYNNSTFFHGLIQQIPEISNARDDVIDEVVDEPRKIFGIKIFNKANPEEVRWAKRVIRETDYSQMPYAKQEKFIEWLWSQNVNRLPTKDARAKLLEYNGKKEVIEL